MNEKQLAMGETTIVGRKELRNPNGLFHIEDLQGIALQRCSTAREAVLLMGRLAEQYGYRDGGECLTVADKKELWFFEITGAGPDDRGGFVGSSTYTGRSCDGFGQYTSYFRCRFRRQG